MPDTPSDDPLDPTLLDRYFAGQCTPAEAQRVAAALVSDLAHARDAAALRRMLKMVHAARPPASTSEADVAQLRARIAQNADRSAVRPIGVMTQPHAYARGQRRGIAVGVAAAIAVAAVASFAAWRLARVSAGGTQSFREFASAAGSRSTITLRDGTTLVLGPATHLRVPADFGRTARTVDLDGEAQFTVVHDATHPFAVRTARAVVRDVGTSFVVRAYADDAVERVVVQEGQVDLSACRSTISGGVPAMSSSGSCAASVHATPLVSGDLATIADTAVSVRHSANVARWTAWVQGGLVFEDTPFGEVLHDIGRAFDVRITVADSALLTRHVTAQLSGQPLDIALDAVTRAMGARYERTESGIVIRSGLARTRGSSPSPRPPPTTVRVTETSK